MAFVADIKRAVARRYRIPLNELNGRSQCRVVARPRQLAMTLACECTRHSAARVGNFFERDHTTVLHARRQVARLAAEDLEVRAALDELRLLLGSVEEPANG